MLSLDDSKEIFNDILNESDTLNNENICLISYKKLEDNYITLDCGHKYNYLAIYNEIEYQKTKKILDNRYLKLNEIKCPYCRNISNKLLPYYKYYNVKNIKGVTFPDNFSIKNYDCSFVDKKTGKKCNGNGCITKLGVFCNKHIKYNIEEETKLFNIDKTKYNNYKKNTIKELREKLKENNLKMSGNKEDLITRLILYS